MATECNWPFPPTDLSLSGDDIHLWCVCLQQSDAIVAQMAKVLSADELKRAKRFHFQKHRDRFIVAHALLRKLLSDYTKTELRRIVFAFSKNGKPCLLEKPGRKKIGFNLSHSKDYALIGFAHERAIGVDLEYIRDITDMAKVAEHVFSKNEISYWHTFSEIEKKEAFYKFWTRKEAYLKAVGEGFTSAVNTIDVSVHPFKESTTLVSGKYSENQNRWTVRDLKPLSGFAAAFAVAGDKADFQCWQVG